MLNERRRESFIAFLYDLSLVLFSGTMAEGIINSNVNVLVSVGGGLMSLICFALAFYMQGD